MRSLSVLGGLRKIQPRGCSGNNLIGAANGIRTHTTQILSLLPLPIGLPRHIRITAIYYINIISNFFYNFQIPNFIQIIAMVRLRIHKSFKITPTFDQSLEQQSIIVITTQAAIIIYQQIIL